MESMPGQLRDAGRDASSSPSLKQDAQSFTSPSSLKPNQVSETSLYGVPIVCLVIDGKERLCLAQISNTLLKSYSYNEIHNRRVALGITCVQCTPVQLELLRRAGAMPISSRRCGMITKREAERLCKSFLGAHSPPKLPENFAFDVSHDCAWGSRGSFIPARYNSSRAKCIKCTFCNMYFSPNKFIFHSHRTPESKYLQPDAANFNSWRRHLKLTEKKPSEDINHAWEDVKAMFNGGSRKRTLPMSGSGMSSSMKSQASSSLVQTSSPEIPHKTLRRDEDQGNNNLSLASSARSYPVIPVPSKSFGMLQKIPPPLFPHHPYGFPGYGLCQKKNDGVPDANKTNVPGVFWPGAKDTLYPAFPVFWPTAGGLPLPPYPGSPPKPPELPGVRQGELDLSDQSDRGANTPKDNNHHQHHQQDAGERCPSSQSSTNRNDEDKSGDETPQRKISYISAFRPVVKDAETIAKLYGNRDSYGVRPGYLSPDFVSESSSYRSVSPDRDSVVDDDDPDVDVESNRGQEDEELIRISPGGDQHDSPMPDRVSSGAEESQEQPASSPGAASASAEDSVHTGSSDEDRQMRNGSPLHEVYAHEKDGHVLLNEPSSFGSKQSSSPRRSNGLHHVSEQQIQRNYQEQKDRQADGALRIDISVHERDLENMAKEELQKQLVEQVELRKKLEREFQHLKDNFQDQMKRELSYREEMVQQLQIVRDTLCSELDQERKARYAIQQKLKEAHDALHHFSCKMLTPRQCTGACTFKPPLLPP
ncbi:SKI family transcriptional corepressor 1a isoform X1 [Thunnus albacares]|uniref:SKI family transcriptional corepressor 1a isoform X4 n=1 Tax=Thunnus maccoyii TaxID=8240 RepID=UPI001C4CFE09|nr:SKI family transcriptional corepressor 1a isoform X4 [Thunnus maccoyii]XP_044217029.1 SKI family transcriptional corepressor 1a isoform X1 [Thunnus albacares]XP_044217039.1 SKI family transcriptional corepressor 1a isoform X1 [Thunnus albacares]